MLARRTSDARPAEGENGFTGFDLRHDSISEQRQGEGSAGDRAYSINVAIGRGVVATRLFRSMTAA